MVVVRTFVLLVFVLVTTWVTAALGDTVAASLYEEGVALLKAKKFEEACDKLSASYKREPLSGTLMTLAQCHELRGMTATAWDEYSRAAGMAQTEGRKAYEEKAAQLAAKLEPSISKLAIELAPGASHDGLEVTLAGVPVDKTTFGLAVALDPGDYAIEASAPGHATWSTTITVNEPGKTVTVTIPALTALPVEPAPLPPPPPPPAPVATPLPPPSLTPLPAADEDGTVPGWAWAVGAVGIAMGGVAVGFLVDDLAAIGELRDRCVSANNGNDNDYLCDPGYDADADNARKNRSGALALGFGIGSVVALTASIIGIATAGGDESPSAGIRLAPSLDGLSLEGHF